MSILSRKQSTENDAWLETLAKISSIVSREEIDALTNKTISEIQSMVGNKKSAYAWSGGKDSIVLGHICERMEICDSMIGICDLEYPAFLSWIAENQPKNCTVINTHQNLDWLCTYPKMLFPQNSAIAGHWFSIVQHRAQQNYFKANQLDILLLGRRHADGNFVGRGSNIYTDGKGITRYSPLSNWSHEHILAYLHYHQLPLPPVYGWKNGYLCGTHPWPARQWTGDIENGWREIYSIDSTIVTTAAQKIESAYDFLNKEVRV